LEYPSVIRTVLEGLRGEDSIAEFCRHEGIVLSPLVERLSETGKKRLAGDTARAAVARAICGLAGGAHTGGSQSLRISDSSQRKVLCEHVKPLDREIE
jgi:hypothetical protein